MLTPEYLQRITEQSEEYATELRNNIIQKIINRMIARIGRGEQYLFTPIDKWQIDIIQDSGVLLEEIQRDIIHFTKKQDKEIAEAFKEAGIKAIEYDDQIYKDAGLSPTPLKQSPLLARLMERNFKGISSEVHNFTRTIANESQRLYIKECDNAYRVVTSGAVSYRQAVKEAVNSAITQGGIVKYPSGHKDTLEVAITRAVRTGVNQTTSEIQLVRMEEMDWDIIGTSAHLGARTGDGGNNHTNHFYWQGKWFSRTGKNKQYDSFQEVTGYGLVDGICGANCRHGFFAGDGKTHPYTNYNAEENENMEKLQKKQRLMERRIRSIKKEVLGLGEAVDKCEDKEAKFELQLQYDKESLKLRERNKAYKDYCQENSLRPYNERLQIAKWNREVAARSSGAATRRYNIIKQS